MENANYRNRVQQSGYYKVFYHYLSRLRLHFHELLCSLKCHNKVQKCTKSILVGVLSTQTKSNFTSIKMMTRPPMASGYRFHHVTKHSIH